MEFLDPKHLKFITEYMKDANVCGACKRCGISPKTGYAWIKLPLVQAEIESAQKKARDKTGYDLEQALKEVNEGIELAKSIDSPSSMASLLTLKSKLTGLYVDRQEVRQAGFQIFVEIDDKKDCRCSEYLREIERLKELITHLEDTIGRQNSSLPAIGPSQ